MANITTTVLSDYEKLSGLRGLRQWTELIANNVGEKFPLVADLVHSRLRNPSAAETVRRQDVRQEFRAIQTEVIPGDPLFIGGNAAVIAERAALVTSLTTKRALKKEYHLAATSAIRYILSCTKEPATTRIRSQNGFDDFFVSGDLGAIWDIIPTSLMDPGGAVAEKILTNVKLFGAKQNPTESVTAYYMRFVLLMTESFGAGNDQLTGAEASYVFVTGMNNKYQVFKNVNKNAFNNLQVAVESASNWTVDELKVSEVSTVVSGTVKSAPRSETTSTTQQPRHRPRKTDAEWALMDPWARYDWKRLNGVRCSPPRTPRAIINLVDDHACVDDYHEESCGQMD